MMRGQHKGSKPEGRKRGAIDHNCRLSRGFPTPPITHGRFPGRGRAEARLPTLQQQQQQQQQRHGVAGGDSAFRSCMGDKKEGVFPRDEEHRVMYGCDSICARSLFHLDYEAQLRKWMEKIDVTNRVIFFIGETM
ncbi:uncharacterized protein LOC124188203 [Neodiprion fabricii]|uniref:uncharacterized protein LOC124188203 n=1 Tax=Neodiprion fabricii TaxID=2872261 RepID=UPI001ED92B76|nr:uncharacterized protein LOC124188203 [Neodiprion fabricii]